MPRQTQKVVRTTRHDLTAAIARAAAIANNLQPRPGSNLQEDDFEVQPDIEYDLISEKGKGELATVYQSRERQSGKTLAVKVYHGLKNPLMAIQRRLATGHEGQVLQVLRGRHPHIISGGTVRKLFHEERDTLELPLQYYRYALSELMDDTKEYRGLVEDFISIPPWYGHVVTQMLDALEFLHRKEIMILHRNIDPNNILFDRTTHFMLAGFGLATFGPSPKGEHGGPARSYTYMPPEVFKPDVEETTAVDLWALGVLCLDMLSLLPSIPEQHCNYDRLKELPWCYYLCELAKNVDKPEVEMMVAERVVERLPAGSVLRFVRTTGRDSIQLPHFKASLELIYLLFRVQTKFGQWPEADIRECARVYMQTFGEPQQPPVSTGQGAQRGSGSGTTGSSSAELERSRTTGSTTSPPPPPPGASSRQPPPPSGRPSTEQGGRPAPSSPTTTEVMGQLVDVSRGRAVMLVTGIERVCPGAILEYSKKLFPKPPGRTAPPGGGGTPLPEASLESGGPERDDSGPSGAQSGQSTRRMDAQRQAGEVKGEDKQPSPPASSILQGQRQRTEPRAETSACPRPEPQSQQDQPPAKEPSSPLAPRPAGQASRERGQSKAGPSRAAAQAQPGQAQAKQSPGAQSQREGTQAKQSAQATPAQGRGATPSAASPSQSSAQARQSADASRSRPDSSRQQTEPPARPPARGQAVQQPPAQGQQGQGKSEGEEQQAPRSTRQGSKTGSSGKARKRR